VPRRKDTGTAENFLTTPAAPTVLAGYLAAFKSKQDSSSGG